MKVLTIGRDLEIINTLLAQEGLTVTIEEPEVIITHGGDGYLLEAERIYPGIPKLPIRRNSICKTCINHDTTHAIKALARGTISRTAITKLEAATQERTLLALNEFSLYHAKPTQAVRFSVQINDEAHVEQAIGDGVVVATPFGSHAYYRSITNSTFRVGIGIAFNNTTEPVDHTVIRASDTIKLTIIRGPAYLLYDNDPLLLTLKDGEVITIKESQHKAVLLGIDHFRCPDCGKMKSLPADHTDNMFI